MIAGCGFTNTRYFLNDYYLVQSNGLEAIDVSFEKSLTELSLERLRELMFVPRKIQLKPIYNRKPLNRLIRNNLPQRIRLNENAES